MRQHTFCFKPSDSLLRNQNKVYLKRAYPLRVQGVGCIVEDTFNHVGINEGDKSEAPNNMKESSKHGTTLISEKLKRM